MLNQQKSKNLRSAISSQESESGLMRFVLPDGTTTDPYGRDHVPVNLSARQAKEMDFLTSGTCGRTGFISSKCADLSKFLANKCQAKTDLLGSTLFKLTWKKRDTPTLHSIYALRASVRRTSGKGSGSMQGEGLPTPQAMDANGTALAPRYKPDTKRDPLKIGSYRIDLKDLPFLIFSKPPYEEDQWNWNTPSATDYKGGYQGGRIRNGKLSTDRLDVTAQLTYWPTVTTIDNNQVRGEGAAKEATDRGTTLGGAARLAHLPTPRANEYKAPHQPPNRQGGKTLNQTCLLMDIGSTQIGSTAEMKSTVQLNPALSRWLMSLPPAWCEHLPTLKQLEGIQK